MTNPLQVLVTGATGRTGALVVQKLQQRPEQFTVRGFARSKQKAFDVISKPEGTPGAVVTTDFQPLFEQTTPGL